jgi:hypothetical protein
MFSGNGYNEAVRTKLGYVAMCKVSIPTLDLRMLLFVLEDGAHDACLLYCRTPANRCNA